MTIRKINSGLSTTTKLEQLNDMILELNGLIAQGKFDINEIEAIYDALGSGYTRKFLRNQSLGHTLSTYVNWTHVHAESGYSIWSYSPTNYLYNSVNKLYFDNKILENRGQANSSVVDVFDHVFFYNGDSGSGYRDHTTEAGTESGTSFEVMDSDEDYLYCGLGSTFGGVSFEWDTRGSNYTLDIEYWNGTAWTTLDISGATYVDDTSSFESDGRIYWDIPGNWAMNTVNSQSAYWIRVSTSTLPTTTATAYLIIPANSVTALLKLSSEEITEEDWAWCEYSGTIYVTIRNTGNSNYEGNYHVKSSSSSINKQNFFIHNHEYTADYEDSTA